MPDFRVELSRTEFTEYIIEAEDSMEAEDIAREMAADDLGGSFFDWEIDWTSELAG